MPSFGPVYGQYASESGAGVPWTDPSNIDGPPDGLQATAVLDGLTDPSTAVASIVVGEVLAGAVPATARLMSLSVVVVASDSGFAVTPANIFVQLVDGTPIGNTLSTVTTAAGITTYTISGSWGVPFNRPLVENLRLAVYMTTDGASTVGVDAVGVRGTYAPVGGFRSRSRLTRSR